MKLRFNALPVALAALIAAGGAQALMQIGQQVPSGGNSSVIFVAVDENSNISLAIDLGLTMSAFTNSTTLTSGLTSPIFWDFNANNTNAPTVGVNDWTVAYNRFKNTQSDGDFSWGVFAGDNVLSALITPTNAIPGRGLLATGNPTVEQMLAARSSGPIATAIGNQNNFIAASNGLASGNHQQVDNGSNTATAADVATGSGWFPDIMGEGFNGSLTWSMLLANRESSAFNWQQLLPPNSTNPIINQFGNPTTIDSLSPMPINFTFDIATNQLVLAPVPEPGTYAMLLAGLCAVGFMVRRRKA